MTLKTKKIILNGTTFICGMIFITLLVSLILFNQVQNERFIILFIKSIILFATSIVLHIYFRKSLPSEIIFFSVITISLSILCLRVLQDMFGSDNYLTLLITGRVAYLFKYISLLSIFGASLFSFSIKKQKIGSWLVISVATSIIIASILHFNTGLIERNFLPMVIYKYEELFISISVGLISALTYLKSGFDAKNRDFFYLGWATLLLTITILLAFTLSGLFTEILMLLSLILGTVVYLRSIHYITLWS